MLISLRRLCLSVAILCVAYTTCSVADSYYPNRPPNRPYWWISSKPMETLSPIRIERATTTTKDSEEPCTCQNPPDCTGLGDCPPKQYEEEPPNNEVDNENVKQQSESTTKIASYSVTESTRTTSKVIPGGTFSAKEHLVGSDDDHVGDDSEKLYCGVDARDKIFEWKGQDEQVSATDFAEYPWVLYVYHKEDNVVTTLCGATLIEPNFAITAAHCVGKYRNKEIFVRGGEWDLQTEGGETETYEHQDIRVAKIIPHKNFTDNKMWDDIAILVLEKPFLWINNIRTVCLPTTNDTYVKQCIAAGWGNTGSDINPLEQRYMRQSRLILHPRDKCQSEFQKSGKGRRFYLKSTQICARSVDGGGTCVGGCGGGLFCQIAEAPFRFVLVGLASWGKCSNNQTGVFTNVMKYNDWIMDTIDDINNPPSVTKK